MGMGFHGAFWIYTIVSLMGGFFGFTFLPETKGKTLIKTVQKKQSSETVLNV